MAPKTTLSEPLHLLRALLRACTYLPDPAARRYFHVYILQRFRKKSSRSRFDAASARKSISLLTRASNGDLLALTKVMHHTYGRAGKRRNVLVDEILRQQRQRHTAEPPTAIRPDVQRVLKPPTTILLHGGAPTPAKPHEGPPTPFERLLADQILQRPARSNRPAIRSAYAPIPLENSFKRPLPVRRERNIRRVWRNDMLERILPPLPEGEWNRLRDLATGVVKWKGSPKRRIRVGGEKEGGLLSVEYLKAPILHAHAKVRREELAQREWHSLTPKFMRRMYASIWELSPKAHWDEGLRDWVYTWGGGRSAASRGETNKVIPRDLQLFDGIEKLEVKQVKKGGQRGLPQSKGIKNSEVMQRGKDVQRDLLQSERIEKLEVNQVEEAVQPVRLVAGIPMHGFFQKIAVWTRDLVQPKRVMEPKVKQVTETANRDRVQPTRVNRELNTKYYWYRWPKVKHAIETANRDLALRKRVKKPGVKQVTETAYQYLLQHDFPKTPVPQVSLENKHGQNAVGEILGLIYLKNEYGLSKQQLKELVKNVVQRVQDDKRNIYRPYKGKPKVPGYVVSQSLKQPKGAKKPKVDLMRQTTADKKKLKLEKPRGNAAKQSLKQPKGAKKPKVDLMRQTTADKKKLKLEKPRRNAVKQSPKQLKGIEKPNAEIVDKAVQRDLQAKGTEELKANQVTKTANRIGIRRLKGRSGTSPYIAIKRRIENEGKVLYSRTRT